MRAHIALIVRSKAGLIEVMSRGQSREQKREEKILDEVRDRVIRESMNLEEEEAIRGAREAELEALMEISDLPNRRIREIDREVRSRFKKPKKTKKTKNEKMWRISRKTLRKVLGWAVFFGMIAAVIGVSAAIRARQNAQHEAELAADEAFRTLYEAASEGNLQMVQYLMEDGVEPDRPGYGSSLLHVAVNGGHLKVVEYLLREGADINRTDSSGRNVLYCAEERPDLAVRRVVAAAFAEASPEGSPVRELWSRGISYTEQSFVREVDAGNLANVRLFLRADEGVYAQGWERSGLNGAIKTEDLAILTEILENGEGVESQWINSAFLQAARRGPIEMMELLLAHGADIDYQYREYEFTPLLAVVLDRDTAGMEFLLGRGADPNKNGADNNITPLMMPFQRYSQHLSRDREKIALMTLLLGYGANINDVDRDGRTVLDYARASGMPESVRFIKDAGAEISFTEESFRHLVKENDSLNLQSFLEQGIDPDLEGFDYYEENMTGLIHAAGRGYEEVCRVLLEAGADVGHETEDQNTALHKAYYEEHYDLCRMLFQYGADTETLIRGATILMSALEDGDIEMIKVLLEADVEIGRNVLDLIKTNSFAWNSDQRAEIRKLIWRHTGLSG